MFEEDLPLIPVIDEKKCNGCEECVEICPPQAIEMNGEVAKILNDLCEECGECVPVCPEEAISLPWE